jgi:hypothetical protein
MEHKATKDNQGSKTPGNPNPAMTRSNRPDGVWNRRHDLDRLPKPGLHGSNLPDARLTGQKARPLVRSAVIAIYRFRGHVPFSE